MGAAGLLCLTRQAILPDKSMAEPSLHFPSWDVGYRLPLSVSPVWSYLSSMRLVLAGGGRRSDIA